MEAAEALYQEGDFTIDVGRIESGCRKRFTSANEPGSFLGRHLEIVAREGESESPRS